MAVDYHTQNGLNAYKAYIALKQHFTKPDFDYFKYGGKTNASMDSYKKRKDAIYFEMLGKSPDVVEFIAFNLATFDKVFPKDLATNSKYKQNYEKMLRYIQSLTYNLKNTFNDVGITKYSDIIRICVVSEGKHPEILKLFIKGKINLITFCAFDRQFCLVDLYDRKIEETIVWPKISLKIKKLRPFLRLAPVVTKVLGELISQQMVEVQPLKHKYII